MSLGRASKVVEKPQGEGNAANSGSSGGSRRCRVLISTTCVRRAEDDNLAADCSVRFPPRRGFAPVIGQAISHYRIVEKLGGAAASPLCGLEVPA